MQSYSVNPNYVSFIHAYDKVLFREYEKIELFDHIKSGVFSTSKISTGNFGYIIKGADENDKFDMKEFLLSDDYIVDEKECKIYKSPGVKVMINIGTSYHTIQINCSTFSEAEKIREGQSRSIPNSFSILKNK